ncbi:MAG: LemA family protein [Candidatus Altiarchaeales archaeon]|nr:LemA family protein [Candidatus Altiarchaeales archaeon]
MFWILIVLVLMAFLVVMFLYNRLITLRARVENAWSQIDVQLKRRYNLIPNLVDTVKGYMEHERQTLESVTQARAALANAEGVKETAEANNMLTSALKSLFAVSENYPDLKANQNFLNLQEQLTTTENKIAYARQFYNDSVMTYNIACQKIPTNFVAALFNFKEKEYFEVVGESERSVPKVDFSGGNSQTAKDNA